MSPVRKAANRSTKSSKQTQIRKKRQVPKSEIGLNVDKTFTFSTLLTHGKGDITIKASKSFQETPAKDYAALFLEKCEQCKIICNFASSSIDVKAKATKTQLLKHLASCFTIPQLVRTISLECMMKFYDMLSVNLFRPMPAIERNNFLDAHDSLLDAAWPHISLAYDALMASFNCQFANQLSPEFIYQLVGNAVALDDRERIVVRDILHSLYTKFMNQRSIVREKIADQFADGKCSCELLQFFASVVSGFNSPLNPEHVTFYHKSILPLHSLNALPQFWEPFVDLIVKYISKSGFLLDPTVAYILKHWPKVNKQKEVLFLKELEKLMMAFDMHLTPTMASDVFSLIGNAILNENSDVAETAIDVLLNPNLAFTLKTHAVTIYILIMRPAYRASKKHWDEAIRTNAYSTLQTLSELDQSTFAKINEELRQDKVKREAQREQQKVNWTKIFEAAKNNDRTLRDRPFVLEC